MLSGTWPKGHDLQSDPKAAAVSDATSVRPRWLALIGRIDCSLIGRIVLKSQVGLLVGRFGFAMGALAFPADRWEHRSRGQMIIGQRVRYQRIGEGLATIPALQKPFCHRLKIPRFSTKAYATENFPSNNLLSIVPRGVKLQLSGLT
jgi:hypothetical protein